MHDVVWTDQLPVADNFLRSRTTSETPHHEIAFDKWLECPVREFLNVLFANPLVVDSKVLPHNIVSRFPHFAIQLFNIKMMLLQITNPRQGTKNILLLMVFRFHDCRFCESKSNIEELPQNTR